MLKRWSTEIFATIRRGYSSNSLKISVNVGGFGPSYAAKGDSKRPMGSEYYFVPVVPPIKGMFRDHESKSRSQDYIVSLGSA